MLDDQSSHMDDIAELIAQDPALTSKLLRLANSALFRFPSQIHSIAKAVNVIGGEALYNLVIAETARSVIEHFGEEPIDVNRFWRQSVLCSLLAKDLARMAKIRGSERFFVLGLLHNLGELIVASQTPELATKCEQAGLDLAPWKHQQEIFEFTYADCSADVLKAWGLPDTLYLPITRLHDEKFALANKEAAVLLVAARVAFNEVTEANDTCQWLDAKLLNALDLTPDDIDDLLKMVKMEATGILALMGV